MREILFRGKRRDNGDWIYWDMLGHITTHTGKISKYTQKTKYGESYYYYAYQLWNRIDHSTIGQYTGLKDKNGKRIFEGDVVVLHGRSLPRWYHEGQHVVVEYDGSGFVPLCEYDSDCGDFVIAGECEIIGNVHDNPELMRGDGNG